MLCRDWMGCSIPLDLGRPSGRRGDQGEPLDPRGGDRNMSIFSSSPSTASTEFELLLLLLFESLRWRESESRPSRELKGRSSSESTGVKNDGVNALEEVC